ncbi:hypothetical protein BGZ70_006905 [Mortierella alpina]|uniref:Uncharacterized protein n=1 Tax=Mortierella alpina TaxID=64518 RepID=A0A9P6J761_MORAP|nr:hypothetical protein BGZ70_006905 [Mortierella alpina]
MKLERWAKKLFKPSSTLSHSSKSCPAGAVSPSRHSLEQCNPSAWSTPSARARRRQKTFFGFSTRNASLGSLLSVAYGSGLADLARQRHPISSADLSSTTGEALEEDVRKDCKESLEDSDKEPETTTIYYHPPPPPHARHQQQQGQADETREDGEQRQLLQDQLVEEAKKLARRRLERLGHLSEAKASAQGVGDSRQRRVKVRHDVDGESLANPCPVGQIAKAEHSTRNRSETGTRHAAEKDTPTGATV